MGRSRLAIRRQCFDISPRLMTSPANPTRETAEQRIGPEVKRLRDQAGLSVRALAERAGFSASFVSQVENGLASPSISSLERIASALNVGVGDFFGPSRGPEILIVKAGERPHFYSSWSRAHVSVLTPGRRPTPCGQLRSRCSREAPAGTRCRAARLSSSRWSSTAPSTWASMPTLTIFRRETPSRFRRWRSIAGSTSQRRTRRC